MSKRTSSLLIDEASPQVIPSLAVKLGVNAAILLQQIHFWTKHAERAKDETKYRSGKWWTYNTYAEWQEQLPWLSESGIRKLVKQLKDRNLIAVVKHDKGQYDHTLWYTINYQAVEDLGSDDDTACNSMCDSGTDEVAESDVSDVSESDTSIESPENPESPAESPTGGAQDAFEQSNRTPQQLLTDQLYRLLDETYNIQLKPEQYSFHVGCYKRILEKKNATSEECERVIAHMVAVWPKAPKIEAETALQDVRLGRDDGSAYRQQAESSTSNGYSERKPASKPESVSDEEAGIEPTSESERMSDEEYERQMQELGL